MHNILRAYVTATSLLIDADETQVDKVGSKKAVSTVWSEMPKMSADLIQISEQLLDDPTLAAGDPCKNEEQWLKAVIDEVGTRTAGEQSDEESWASLARYTAWLAFCLRQSTSYAKDADYGKRGFEQIRDLLSQADDFEKSIVVTSVTEAGAHLESTGSETSKEIVKAYDELVRGL